MLHLNNKGYCCPKPISDQNNGYLQEIQGKPAIIVNFLNGKSKKCS